MGQKAQLWWDLPALDAFDLLKAIYEIPTETYKERLHTLAELLDVTKHLHTQIRRLSLGERMKMELIAALIHRPRVLFLDEPTIGLDVVSQKAVRQFLREYNRLERDDHPHQPLHGGHRAPLLARSHPEKTGEMIFDGAPDGLTKKGECRLRVRLMQKPTHAELSEITGVPHAAIPRRHRRLHRRRD